MESRMFDLPEPFKPVIALKDESKSEISVRVAYDLKPSRMTFVIYIVAQSHIELRHSTNVTKLWKQKKIKIPPNIHCTSLALTSKQQTVRAGAG